MRRGGGVVVFTQSLNESPSEKEGKFMAGDTTVFLGWCLNESPSEKEGK